MGFGGTYLQILKRAMVGAFTAIGMMGCLYDDPSPCTIKDDITPDPRCVQSTPQDSFKVEYVTANGTVPSGRYGFVESNGLNVSQAETECKHALQYVFNTDISYVNFELNEVNFYRGNICGAGYHVKSDLGDIKVKRTRKTGVHTYDYTLELTCANY